MAQMHCCHYNIMGNGGRNHNVQIESYEEITSKFVAEIFGRSICA